MSYQRRRIGASCAYFLEGLDDRAGSTKGGGRGEEDDEQQQGWPGQTIEVVGQAGEIVGQA